MSYTVPTLDELKEQILLDYANHTDRDGNLIDTGKGSLSYLDASVLASALQGIAYRLKYTEQQILPNLAGARTATINGWASVFGVTRLETDNDADVVQNIISKIQEPAAGGNAIDWVNWARAVVTLHENSDEEAWAEIITDAAVLENDRRPGSVDLFIISDWSVFPAWVLSKEYAAGDFVRHSADGYTSRIFKCLQTALNEEPDLTGNTAYWELLGGATADAVAAVQQVIESEKRPLGIWDTSYGAVTITPLDITATVTGVIDTAEAGNVLSAWLAQTRPGQIIARAKIITLLVELGAVTVNLTAPAVDVFPVSGEKIIAGVITVEY